MGEYTAGGCRLLLPTLLPGLTCNQMIGLEVYKTNLTVTGQGMPARTDVILGGYRKALKRGGSEGFAEQYGMIVRNRKRKVH